jgi:transcriptional regulator GlxA family with amidase domain
LPFTSCLTTPPDTLIISGGDSALDAAKSPLLLGFLAQMAGKCRRLSSVCLGAFVLAEGGYLNGRRATTHWEHCQHLQDTFPAIDLRYDSIFEEDRGIWTSAGVTAGIDMALAMVAHDLDAGAAGQVAKGLVLSARRPGYQSQFSPLLQAQAKADSPFADLVAWILAHLDGSLDVPVLAARAGLSERTFHRKFLAATGETPARFVESARLDAARLLLSRDVPLKSVAARVGLAPAARFAEAFERRFGLTPNLFRGMHAEI